MNPRFAVAAAVLGVAGVLAVPAVAVSKTVCLQVVDDTGDGTVGASSHDALDIVSADVATGKKNLVAAVRLKSLAADPVLAGGTTYTFVFTIGGVAHQLSYKVYSTGETKATITIGSGIDGVTGPASAVVDQGTATILWTVPRKSIPSLKKPGAKLTGLDAKSAFGFNAQLPTGTSEFSSGSDDASTGRAYVDNTPTCLKGV
jgi:hypothetical protein